MRFVWVTAVVVCLVAVIVAANVPEKAPCPSQGQGPCKSEMQGPDACGSCVGKGQGPQAGQGQCGHGMGQGMCQGQRGRCKGAGMAQCKQGSCPMPCKGMCQGMCPMGGKGQGVRIPLINEQAPSFVAETTQGEISFPEDYAGKWVILFSHPADFTPVCTTEFMTFASMLQDFEDLNCQLVGLSIDSTFSHIAWLRTIKERIVYNGMENVEVTFPVIADLKMDVARKYGMLQPTASDTQAVRAVFFIDPEGKVRALLYYPLSNGRNFAEIKRLLIAMQTSDAHEVATPADWQPGDDVIVPPPGSCNSARDRVANPGPDSYMLDWFLTFKKLPKSSLVLPTSMQ